MNNPVIEKYTRTAQLLHWLIALLVVAQFSLAWYADTLPRGEAGQVMGIHKSIGATILVLAIVRLIWRFMHKPPAFPATMPRWEAGLSAVTHWGLYFLIFAMPISGWMMSSAAGRDVSWFGLFNLPRVIGESETAGGFFHETHEVLAIVLLVVALLHIIGAIWHAALKKDGIMQRMLP